MSESAKVISLVMETARPKSLRCPYCNAGWGDELLWTRNAARFVLIGAIVALELALAILARGWVVAFFGWPASWIPLYRRCGQCRAIFLATRPLGNDGAIRPPEQPLCGSCGYDLTGNESGICPECGWKLTGRIKALASKALKDGGGTPAQSCSQHSSPI